MFQTILIKQKNNSSLFIIYLNLVLSLVLLLTLRLLKVLSEDDRKKTVENFVRPNFYSLKDDDHKLHNYLDIVSAVQAMYVLSR